MRILKSAVAFVLVFSMMAVTVVCAAVIGEQAPDSAEQVAVVTDSFDVSEPVYDKSEEGIASVSASVYTPRLTAPAKTNAYYYSDKNVFYKYGYGMPNCTAYAWGRAYEILKTEPKLCIYDAQQWYDYNKSNNYYSYGQTPKLGAIACYTYADGTVGHVAVVEKIENGTVYYSNSAWGGSEFYISTSSVSNPGDINSNWTFQGFIYIGEYGCGDDSSDYDVYRITSDDGVNMRSGAGTSYSIVSAIPYGVSVNVTKTQGAGGYNWGYTTYNGVSGWFVTDFAQLINSNGNVEDEDEPDTDKEEYIMGDVDFDGMLTVFDATEIQKIVAKLVTPTDNQLLIGDINEDGDCNVLDATKIRRILAKLE